MPLPPDRSWYHAKMVLAGSGILLGLYVAVVSVALDLGHGTAISKYDASPVCERGPNGDACRYEATGQITDKYISSAGRPVVKLMIPEFGASWAEVDKSYQSTWQEWPQRGTVSVEVWARKVTLVDEIQTRSNPHQSAPPGLLPILVGAGVALTFLGFALWTWRSYLRAQRAAM